MNRRPLGQWMPLLAVAALLAGGVLAADLSSPDVTRVPVPAPAARKTPPATAGPGAPAGAVDVPVWQLPPWLSQVVAGLCLAVGVAAVGLLVWSMSTHWLRVRSAPLTVGPGPPEAGDVVAALDAGLDRLTDSDVDPRRAVIACWVRLEETAAVAGTPRHPSNTPTDLVTSLLGAHRVSVPVLDEFAAVYRQARYAAHVVDERMRTAAVAALRHLRDELTADAGLTVPTSDPSG